MKMTNISWQHRLYHRIHTYVVFDNDRNVVVNNISRMRVPLLIPTPTTMRCRSVDTILPRMMRLLIALSLKSSDQSCHLMFSFCHSKTLCRNCTRMIDRSIDAECCLWVVRCMFPSSIVVVWRPVTSCRTGTTDYQYVIYPWSLYSLSQ